LHSWENKLPEVVAALRKSLYVDDLLNGGQTVQQIREHKSIKTWVVPGKPTVILTHTRGGMLEIELVRFMDLLPCQGIYM